MRRALTRNAYLLTFGIFAASCSPKGGTDETDGGHGDPECDRYIACSEAVDPGNGASGEYGEEGTCWAESTEEQCAIECAMKADVLELQYPNESACGAGGTGGTADGTTADTTAGTESEDGDSGSDTCSPDEPIPIECGEGQAECCEYGTECNTDSDCCGTPPVVCYVVFEGHNLCYDMAMECQKCLASLPPMSPPDPCNHFCFPVETCP